jgi:hypothetical protein
MPVQMSDCSQEYLLQPKLQGQWTSVLEFGPSWMELDDSCVLGVIS